MREFKFRYWSPQEGVVKGPYGLIGVAIGMGVELVPMQFTGLHDKNGKEIYEGDVIEFKNQEGVWPDQIGRQEVDYPFVCGNAHLGEVIGNVYENPELLTKGETNA